MRRDLRDAVVLVTGAAGGLGRALALELAGRGAHLVLADVDEPGVARTGDAARARGVEVVTHRTDVADEEQTDALAAAALERFGRVDVLVNNAGVCVAAPVHETTAADWEWLLGVNLRGPIRLTRALLPSMRARRDGHVVVVASLAGLIASPGLPAYSTTKFAAVGFAEGLRLEAAADGIDVTTVCPGFLRTGFAAHTRYRNAGFEAFLRRPPRWYGGTAERAARRIVDAVERRRGVVTLGPERLGWYAKRVAPETTLRVTRTIARARGLQA